MHENTILFAYFAHVVVDFSCGFFFLFLSLHNVFDVVWRGVVVVFAFVRCNRQAALVFGSSSCLCNFVFLFILAK